MPVPFNKFEMDIAEYYENCFNFGRFPPPEEDWCAGSVDQFSQKSLKDYGKCIVVGGKVFITCPASSLHCTCSELVDKKLQQAATAIAPGAESGRERPIRVQYKYSCGFTKNKSPDAALKFRYSESRSLLFPIVVEIAFLSGNIGTLTNVLVHYLQETTNVEYAMGIFISPRSDEFSIRIILIKRMLPFSSKARAEMIRTWDDEYIKNPNEGFWSNADFKYMLETSKLWIFDVNLLANDQIQFENLPYRLPIMITLPDNSQAEIVFELTQEDYLLLQQEWQSHWDGESE